MTNRHERRRNAKVSMSTMSVSEFLELPSICAWHGCGKVTKNPYAAGWHSMLLYKGRPKLNFMEIEERNMQRDAVLCPEHGGYLDKNLLIRRAAPRNDGNRIMANTEGQHELLDREIDGVNTALLDVMRSPTPQAWREVEAGYRRIGILTHSLGVEVSPTKPRVRVKAISRPLAA